MSKKILGNGIVFSTNRTFMRELEEQHLATQIIETLPAAEQKLIVTRDAKGRKGKIATLVTGFEGSDEDLSTLGKRLRVSCSVGGSTKEGIIFIQGDLKDRVHALLLEWGYSKTKKR